jgi:hypothetical protein
MTVASLRRGFGIAGIVLLGTALALAPILAFQGEMIPVSAIGITGIACLIVYRLLPRPPAETPDEGEASG